MKIKILETESTKKDEIVKTLTGTTWNTDRVYSDYVIIDCCGGLKLKKGEYETV